VYLLVGYPFLPSIGVLPSPQPPVAPSAVSASMEHPPSARWGIAPWQHRNRKTGRAGAHRHGRPRAHCLARSLGPSRGRCRGQEARRAPKARAGARRGLPHRRVFANGPRRKWRRAGYCPGSRSPMGRASSFTSPPNASRRFGRQRRSPRSRCSPQCCCADMSAGILVVPAPWYQTTHFPLHHRHL
jgi:hypothetical protein